MNTRGRLGLYFGLLLLTSGLGDPTGLVRLPVLFLLKDHLHLGPQMVAVFEAITVLPHNFAFLFGLLRDWRRPFGSGDRGYLMLATPLAAAAYLVLAVIPLSFGRLLAVMLIAAIVYQIIAVALSSMVTRVGQLQAMTGGLSALAEGMETVVMAVAVVAGGYLADHSSPRVFFLAAAAFSTAVFLQSIWNPSRQLVEEPIAAGRPANSFWRPAKDLIHHRAIWPTAAILLLYDFSPGWGTPFFYYLTDKVGLSAEVFGYTRAFHYASVAVATLIYGSLCQRYPLSRLLRWAVVLSIFPGFLFLFISGALQAVVVSAIVGLVVGFANVALFDLLMRSCPKGLEGSATMLGLSAFAFAGSAGDLLGAWIYQAHGGFVVCLSLDAAATSLILPLLATIPRALIATRDGEFAASPAALDLGAVERKVP
ncbi:MAG TPA: MFS transporter [Steroidobacteraceae bacterium]|nr:MFS transporter [Steroidobacteraceae bacterium]